MHARGKLNVVLCWHMHQPIYWDCERNEYRLPWTYLHAMKDYVDMAAHLEAIPEAKAVINFTPTLLEQLDDYRIQVECHLADDAPIKDPLLRALATPVLPCGRSERVALIRACMKVNENRLINRYPPFRRLADIVNYFSNSHDFLYLSDQFLVDLLVWYHLTWIGEVVHQTDTRVQALIEKGQDFSLHDRRILLELIGELLASIIPRYRRLAERGQIELSVTPYAHPIAPLLLDIQSTTEAMPDALMPTLQAYPGGKARLQWHITEGIKTFERFFGFKPKGCWPAEGGISTETMRCLSDAGFQWSAGGQTVLHNSLAATESAFDNQWLHKPYHIDNKPLACFFRDDGLSDLIGFHYADWHADDAVSNLVNHLETIAAANERPEDYIVSIILDGENAWEYYPNNAYHFLSGLYTRLSQHTDLALTTFEAYLKRPNLPTGQLSRLVAGSWVYGTFSTWIGDKDKNRAWDMLGDAKKVFDTCVGGDSLTQDQIAAAERQLAICEGSDWFWWFGDYNSAQSVRDFECLYRVQLTHLYRLLKCDPPEYLSHSFTFGGGHPENDGVMIRNT